MFLLVGNKEVVVVGAALSRKRGFVWFHGVTVSTLDFESSDPSSNLGGTCRFERTNSMS